MSPGPHERRVTAVVTGAGGPAGIGVIRALCSADHRVVPVDADEGAVGLRLGHDGAVVPRADAGGFGDAVARVCAETGAEVLICTVAAELPALHSAAAALDAVGVRRWLPSVGTVEICRDKLAFAELLATAGLDGPATAALDGDGSSARTVPGPWIVKPRYGRGSRDVHAVDDPADLAVLGGRIPDPVLQHRVSGREFTVDALVTRDGTLAGAVPRWRLDTRAGISVRGRTFEHDGVRAATAAVLEALELTGVANVQGFVTPSEQVRLTEVNPRFSGGLPLSLAAGADLVGEYLRGVLGGDPDPGALRARPGVTMFRHFEEVFEEAEPVDDGGPPGQPAA